MKIFNIILFSAIVLPYTVYYVRKYKFTPVSLFLIIEISYFYEICVAPKGQLDFGIKLATIYVVALFFYILGVEFCCRTTTKKNSVSLVGSFIDENDTRNQRLVIWIIVGVSILLCAYLFAAGGVNVFLRSIRDLFMGSNAVYKNERSSFFGVSGMGYIYQFRAILLPVLTVYLTIIARNKPPKIVSIPLLVLMVIFLLGTGQRNAFVFFCLVVVFYAFMMSTQYSINILTKRQIILFGGFAALFMVALTISNGRVSEGDNMILGAIDSVLDRMVRVNPRTALTAFSYIDTQPTCWGYDWLMTMADILPGKSGYLTVSRITYYIAYGTYNGTGDPCIWGSAWYNFGILGCTVFPFILGIGHHHVYKHMLRRHHRNRLYMLLYAALCVYLGMWTYGTPMNLFNIGVVALLFLRWLLFTVFNRSK